MRQGQANSQLPAAVVNQGVTVQKSTSPPLGMFALYSPNNTYDSVFLANYAFININDEMTRVPGIASVSVFGAGQYALRIWVRPDRLAQMGVTVPEIINAIQQQNTVNPSGKIGGEPVPPGQEVHLRGALAGPAGNRGGIWRHCFARLRAAPSCA
jgi:HAE1 family hydrophobic/amphiphilic exporter-1